MIRGFVTGVIWGGVVAAAGLAVMSQVAPLPPAPDAAGPEGTVAAAPAAPDATVVEAAPEPLPAPPEPEEMPEILQKGPEPETDPGPVAEPVAEAGTAGPSAPAPSEDAPQATENASETADAPTQPPMPPVTAAPAAPAAPEVAASDTPAPALPLEPAIEPPPPAPGVPMAEAAPAPQEAPPPAAQPDPAPQDEALLTPAPSEEGALPALVAPVEPLDPADGPTPTLVPEGTLDDRVAGVTTDRLPRIGDAPATPGEEGMEDPTPEAAPAPDPVAEAAPAEGATPLDLFARPFVNVEGKPLFALLLIDEGADPTIRAEVAKLPFPVTFVLDPLNPNSPDAAKAYREAGQEVAMLASGLPAGATAADMEQSFQALDLALPEAVAVVDAPEGGFQDSLDLARQAVPIVADQGRGLLTYDRGLNPADQVARREGVPSAVIFRILDGEGESVPKMRNYLDRAAFKAAQEGEVVVIGRLRPDTVAAILEWSVEGRGASVALAPVSAVLDRPAGN